MSYSRVPIRAFDKLYHTTSTIVFPLPNVTGLNMPAIFALLPILNITLPEESNLQYKAGKIRYPSEFNIPGEIISMKYGHDFRGILRSLGLPFPTAITIDIGTSIRPVSVKFSQTIKITGPPTFEVAEEAVNAIINKIQIIQKWMSLIKNNNDIFNQVINDFQKNGNDLYGEFICVKDYITYADINNKDILGKSDGCDINNKEILERSDITNEIYIAIKNIINILTQGLSHEQAMYFINNMLIPFDGLLYTGDLNYTNYQSEMINIPFELGFTINQNTFAQVMNSYPFQCCYNNARNNSTLLVNHFYKKLDRKGLIVTGKHTFKVNKSGYIMYSGPNLRDMEILYYAFYKRVLLNINNIRSMENYVRKIKTSKTSKSYSLDEWLKYIQEEAKLRDNIIKDRIKYTYINHYTNNPSLTPKSINPQLIIEKDELYIQPLENIYRTTIAAY